jgi:hypothetical protein
VRAPRRDAASIHRCGFQIPTSVHVPFAYRRTILGACSNSSSIQRGGGGGDNGSAAAEDGGNDDDDDESVVVPVIVVQGGDTGDSDGVDSVVLPEVVGGHVQLDFFLGDKVGRYSCCWISSWSDFAMFAVTRGEGRCSLSGSTTALSSQPSSS